MNKTWRRMLMVLTVATVILAIVFFAGGSKLRVEISPQMDETVGMTGVIRFSFNTAVDPEMVESAFYIKPVVKGTLSWEGETLVFRPEATFNPGDTITAGLNPIKFPEGRSFDGISTTFTIREPDALGLYRGQTDDHLVSIDSVSLNETIIYTHENAIISFSPSPDGEMIALSLETEDGGSEMLLIDRGGEIIERVAGPDDFFRIGLAWASDGSTIAYELRNSGFDGRIFIYDLIEKLEQPLFDDPEIKGHTPGWSPDGSRFGFYESNALAIRVIDLETGDHFTLPCEMGEMGAFSPDGSELVYGEVRVLGLEFFPALLRADLSFVGGVDELMDEQEEDFSPAWSPDGMWIAFSRKRIDRQWGFNGEAMLYNTEMGEIIRVTEDRDRASHSFRFSPDADQVLFTRYFIGEAVPTPEAWLYDITTGELLLLSEGIENVRWLP